MSRTRLLAVLALVPAAALAQAAALDAARDAKTTAEAADVRASTAADAASAGGAAPSEEAEAALGVAAERPVATAQEAAGAAAPPDTYTVRPGDTLWDLSGRFLNNPWYWPKIWSYNPEIANPHWIAPGNTLRFFPATDDVPAHVETDAGEPVAEAEPEELEGFSKGDLKRPEPIDESDTVAVSGPYRIGVVTARPVLARHDTFVTPRELAESGSISAAFEEKLMLSSLDKAYARFEAPAGVKPGETYVLFRTERPIRHPRTGELFGYQSTIIGAAKIVAVDDRVASVVITQSFEPIERGTMIGPWSEKLFRRVDRRPNKQALDATIIAGQTKNVTMLGEQQVVFIDRGQRDGVEEGNVFTAVRAGDPYEQPINVPKYDPKFPRETVGEVVVIDVKERASAALVTRSRFELLVGDRLEMQPGRVSAGAGGR